MCEVSQDLRRIRAVAIVRRTDQDNLQSLRHLSFAVAVLSCNCGAWCGWSIGDSISPFNLRTGNIGVPYEVSVHRFWIKTLKLMAQ